MRRAAQILLHLAENEELTAKEIAVDLNLPTATVHHLLNTLVDERLLAKGSQRQYHLGPAMGALLHAYEHQTAPAQYLLGPLRQLAETTGESAYVSGWRDGDIVVLASLEGSHAVRVSELHRGFRGAAHARASGKLLLAYSPRKACEAYLTRNPLLAYTPRTIVDAGALEAEFKLIRKRGYSTDEEEFKQGVACVSAPAVENGVVIAAYTLSAPVDRFEQHRLQLVDAVLAAARSASGRGSTTASNKDGGDS